MSQALTALLGAVVGGLLTLAGGLGLELRRDRRKQIAAARATLSQLRRSLVEIDLLASVPVDGDWHEGPHRDVRTSAWHDNAAYFVGRLSPSEFERVDRLHRDLNSIGEFGFTAREAERVLNQMPDVETTLERFAKPTTIDRLVWRL